ncbi:MAG TPA: hypothetical protein VNO30_20625 [Kofleriaceae bacterium]|nr:hypothetical protein [Kofleriaceae bacterium]
MRSLLSLTFAVALGAMVAGCEIGDTNPPGDGGDDDGGGGAGLSVTWESRPALIPSEPSSDLTVERAVVHQDNLRVVGDAGTFQLDRDDLEWSRGIAPTTLPVPGAPPGLYSQLLFELDGDSDESPAEYAYEIIGTVKVNSEFRPFTVRDTSDLALSLDFSITLPAGGSATIPVRIDFEQVVKAVDFAQVTMTDGRYLVENGSSQMTAVRAAVRAAFGVRGSS